MMQTKCLTAATHAILIAITSSCFAQPTSEAENQFQIAPDTIAEEERSGDLDEMDLRSEMRASVFSKGRLEAGHDPSADELAWIAENCLHGAPKADVRAGLGRIRILSREGYVLGHSSELKIPYWVCEHATKDEILGDAKRRNRFRADPLLKGLPRAELGDYKRSGYDRGHLSAAGNQNRSQALKDETFFLTNMFPQIGPTFNRGIWRELEETVRDWIVLREEAWIITGPMFYDPLEEDETTADGFVPYFTIGDGEVAVPTHCYKIVLSRNDDGEIEAIAFVFENKRYGRPFRLSPYIATINWIEERTGFDFLPELSAPATLELADEIESTKASLWESE